MLIEQKLVERPFWLLQLLLMVKVHIGLKVQNAYLRAFWAGGDMPLLYLHFRLKSHVPPIGKDVLSYFKVHTQNLRTQMFRTWPAIPLVSVLLHGGSKHNSLWVDWRISIDFSKVQIGSLMLKQKACMALPCDSLENRLSNLTGFFLKVFSRMYNKMLFIAIHFSVLSNHHILLVLFIFVDWINHNKITTFLTLQQRK